MPQHSHTETNVQYQIKLHITMP
uniref:Uncharacterized protein n=1 Tax=Arundo donax TaxID=35708 RepID=A0A0A9HUU0_ARUDO